MTFSLLNSARHVLNLARHVKHRYFARRDLWTIALYKIQLERDIFQIEAHKPFAFIGETGIRTSRQYQSTVADPFLFNHKNEVFIFYEVQSDFGVGEIHASAIDENKVTTQYGCVLKEDFHLSYPQVFLHDGTIWMIPETASDKKVWLYRCTAFPNGWERERVLIDEEIVDASLIVGEDGLYILGTNRLPELKLFYAANLHQTFSDAHISITKDKTIVRNAGTPVRIDGNLYRLAQDCQNSYGENINILEVTSLRHDNYSETLVVRNLFKNKPEWMELGCHHMSLARHGHGFLLAIDGKRRDKLINSFTLAFLQAWRGRQ